MKRNYLAPKTESINVDMYVIAASTERGVKSSNADIGSSISNANATRSSEWGNLWGN